MGTDHPVTTIRPRYRVIADRLLVELPDVHDRFLFLCVAQLCMENENNGVQLSEIRNRARVDRQNEETWVKASLKRLEGKGLLFINQNPNDYDGYSRLSPDIYKELANMWVEFENGWKHDRILGIGPWAAKDTHILAP